MSEKSKNQQNVDAMKERMTEIETKLDSPTVCTAKWLQSTVYLMNGHTHSCHHPSPHIIPVSEIKRNYKALHNTEFKVNKRLEMLDGKRPLECSYCWKVEDMPGNHMSDRTYKSTADWSVPYIDKVMESRGGRDINPTYLEVAFDNACNLKCMYCTPDISSKWMEEIERHGPYAKTSSNVGNIEWLKQIKKFPVSSKEENPYIDAFWEWWPELYKNLHTFRITGGEPLMSKNTWRILEEIKKNPRPDFELAINTNMQVPDALIDRFIQYYNDIAPHIRKFDVFTSCEATGPQAEYIRTGLNYGSFMDNCRKFLSSTTGSRLNMMITFNILSLSTFKEFLGDLWQMRADFNPADSDNRVPMMINYLRWPQFQDVRVAPHDVKEKFITAIEEYMAANTRTTSSNPSARFYLEEMDQIARLREYMFETLEGSYRDKQMSDFGGFFPEYDKRRGLDFNSTFPELSSFLTECIEVNARTHK